MDAAASQPAGAEPKLKIDKFSDGPITCLKLVGTIDESFDGKKLASTLKGGTLVLDLAEIRKISSFGIREWVDFIGRLQVEELYLIECAPKIVDQLNMVANFAGKGRVFSFYAPYRCDYCDDDRRVLLQIDKDFESIKAMKPPERPCTACGNPEYFDEDPSSFFSYLVAQAKFELDAGVASFLAAKLNYAVSDSARRLRVEKHIEGRSTYLKLAGDIDGSFPREKLAEGLEGTIVVDLSAMGKLDPAGAAEWRGFLSMITPGTDQILLLGCPAIFVERLSKPEDLGPKAQVLSFGMPYACGKCATTTSHTIDVEHHFDVLKFATPPEVKCPDCNGATTCAAPESLLSTLPALPKPEATSALRKFIKEAQERKPERAQVATTMAEVAASGSRSGWMTTLVSLTGAAVIAVVAVIAFKMYEQKQNEELVRRRYAVGTLRGKSGDARPAWITSPDARFTAACRDEEGSLACVGVSSYRDTIDEAKEEAAEAALEEMSNSLGLRIDDPTFGQQVRTMYGDARQVQLLEFESVKNDPDGSRYDRVRRSVREGRSKVAAFFRKSGGAAVPAQPNDEYWEEYAPAVPGPGSKFLVHVQYRLNADAVKSLVSRYSTIVQVQGAKALPVFPAVAWRFHDVSEGAMLVAMGPGILQQIGLSTQNIVLSVRDMQVRDAEDLRIKMEEELVRLKRDGGNLRLSIKTGDGAPMQYNSPIQKTVVERPSAGPRTGGNSSGLTGSGVNPWDKQGGGSGSRDNPNE